MTEPTSKPTTRKRKIILSMVFVMACAVFIVPFVHIGGRAGYFADDKRLAVEAAARFYKLFNTGDYPAIYEEASPQFQSTGKSAALSAVMAQTKQKFGTKEFARVPGLHVENWVSL